MTNEEYFDIHKDDTPLRMLDNLLEVCGIWRNDAVSRKDAAWRRNDDEVTYWDGEIKAMTDRAFWLANQLGEVLADVPPCRLLTIEDFTPEKLKDIHHVWVEIRPGYYEPELDSYYGGKPYPAVVTGWSGICCNTISNVYQVKIPGGSDSFFLVENDCHSGYGVKWRVWTREPTKEQLEAEPWTGVQNE